MDELKIVTVVEGEDGIEMVTNTGRTDAAREHCRMLAEAMAMITSDLFGGDTRINVIQGQKFLKDMCDLAMSKYVGLKMDGLQEMLELNRMEDDWSD